MLTWEKKKYQKVLSYISKATFQRIKHRLVFANLNNAETTRQFPKKSTKFKTKPRQIQKSLQIKIPLLVTCSKYQVVYDMNSLTFLEKTHFIFVAHFIKETKRFTTSWDIELPVFTLLTCLKCHGDQHDGGCCGWKETLGTIRNKQANPYPCHLRTCTFFVYNIIMEWKKRVKKYLTYFKPKFWTCRF